MEEYVKLQTQLIHTTNALNKRKSDEGHAREEIHELRKALSEKSEALEVPPFFN